MDNETKFSSSELDEKARELLTGQRGEKTDANEFIEKHLDENQKRIVSQIMENPERVKALLNSSAARRLMEMLGKKGKE